LGPAGASPPGLWQNPPGLGPQAGYEQQNREAEIQKEVSGSIQEQVARLIDQARQDTESKVKTELKSIRDVMMPMDNMLDMMLAEITRLENEQQDLPIMGAEAVGQHLSKVEQQWGQEIRTLKQELHQTILAHNHNADLIKHHKDTIDALQERCQKLKGGDTGKTSEQLQRKLATLDQHMKQQSKQRKLEPLFERLRLVEERIAKGMHSGWHNYSAMSAMTHGMSIPPGINPAMMPPGMGGPAIPGKMPATGKGTGAKGTAGAAALAKAAMKPPTDEEILARAGMSRNMAPAATPANGSSEAAAPSKAEAPAEVPLPAAPPPPAPAAGGDEAKLGEES
jgi:hypothetical protein